MMTVANPMAYIPLGERLPAVHLLHSGKAIEGMVPLPAVGEDGEGTDVSIQEVILADTVAGLERTQSVAEVGVRTHDEAVGSRIEAALKVVVNSRSVTFLTPTVERWKSMRGDPYRDHRRKPDLSRLTDESWRLINAPAPVYVSAIACGMEESETLTHTCTAVTVRDREMVIRSTLVQVFLNGVSVVDTGNYI